VTFAELLATIVELLDREDIPYMVTGSLASSAGSVDGHAAPSKQRLNA
jgi:hypothetical protein